MSFTAKQNMFLDTASVWAEKHGKYLGEATKNDLTDIAASGGLKFPHWITRVPTYKVGRGLWALPVDGSPAIKAVADSSVGVEKAPESMTYDVASGSIVDVPAVPVTVVEMTKGGTSTVENIPAKDNLFVPFGNFSDVH